ncbi:MAG: alpha/beta hydrolase [Pseudomonadota bacterium]
MSHATPIVLIHGLFGSQSAPEIIEAFGDTPIYAPDLIGYGANRNLRPEGWALQDQADHIATFIRNLDNGPIHLAGHSVGGAVSALVAFENPDLIASYTSVEGNFTLKDAFWSSEIAKKTQHEVDKIYESYEADPNGWISGAVKDLTPFASQVARQWLANQTARTIRHQAEAVVSATGKPAYLKKMQALMQSQIPVYLIAGANSARDWDTSNWANELCNKRINLTDLGHLMMVESPADYARAVKECVMNQAKS